MRIYEIWREAKEQHSVQVNDIINGLLELGLATFAQLPGHMRHALFRRRTLRDDTKFRIALEPRIKRIAARFRSDEKLDIRLPRPVKDTIRSQAERSHLTMSAVARKRIILQEAQ